MVFSVDYYPFGSLMPQRHSGSESYRYGFIGAENDNEVKNSTGTFQYHEFRAYDNRLGRYKSRDPLSKEYPWNSPYAYAENRVIEGIDLEGLEYLDSDVARIKITNGEAHLNLANFNTTTRNAWKRRDAAGGWPKGHIGFPTKVGEIQHPDFPKNAQTARLSDKVTDPAYNPLEKTMEGTNRQAKRWNQRNGAPSIPTGKASGGVRGAAGAVLVLNAVNWALEQVYVSNQVEDKRLVEEHTNILVDQVLVDLSQAISDGGYIPDKYLNIEDLGSIANVILSGHNPSKNTELYDIGMNIYNNISKVSPPQVTTTGNPTDSDVPADNTAVPIIIK